MNLVGAIAGARARPIAFLSLAFLLLISACSGAEEAATPTVAAGILATPLSGAELTARVPALATRHAVVAAALNDQPPVLRYPADLLQAPAQLAQELALADPEFLTHVRDTGSGAPLRSEIMSVRPTLPSDTSELEVNCAPEQCYRVEMYSYVFNFTTVALVDIAAGQVLSVNTLDNVQPELNPQLTDLAVQIAVNSPEVIAALGGQPGQDEAVMPNVKTALNGSRCERSRHLCVAPTFIVDDRALWAIVDLTDARLVGIRWTELGESGAAPVVTERSLQNEYVWQNFCQQSHTLTQDGWELTYMLTSSDGLKVSDVRYQGQQVLRSAKVVDWHVSYSRQDGFGYSDAVGCPMFSSAAVVAFNGPEVEEIRQDGALVGFALVQDFRSPVWPVACNYRYLNRYEFYQDGRFRVVAVNLGRGCGSDGVYRPVLRIDLNTASAGSDDTFAEWTGQDWRNWETEAWQLQDNAASYTPEGYRYRLSDSQGNGYYIAPGNGQFADGGRGDNAYVYVTRREAERDEGESDLPTIGACCNTDHQQGPEQFITPAEAITGEDLVLWYVAQMENEDTPGAEYCWADTVIEDGLPVVSTWPCAAGPMFVPIAGGTP